MEMLDLNSQVETLTCFNIKSYYKSIKYRRKDLFFSIVYRASNFCRNPNASKE
jgi:hypothetical protein